MNTVKLTIDGQEVEVPQGETILGAARVLGIDIPTLCYLEKCGPTTSCLVCLVKSNGRLVPSCGTKAVPGMVIESETPEIREARRTALELLFSDHVGDCLSPCHRLCPLQMNIPVMIREIEAGKLDQAIATIRQALPLPAVLGRLCNHPCEQGCRRGTSTDDAAAIREMECYVADHDRKAPQPYVVPCKPATGRTVAVVGAGPTGLAAAYFLARQGHSVTVIDRGESAGGTLRAVPESDLPREVLDSEIAQLRRLGIEFNLGLELAGEVTPASLLRDFNAVLLAVGEIPKGGGTDLGVALAGNGIKANPDTCQTNVAGVFAAGAAVKAIKHIVRAMTDGKIAAECVHQFLIGETIRRADKPFSSIMGRLDSGELKTFLESANPAPRNSPCDHCLGYSDSEATGEAGRCLHCDCRSAGHCDFQHYAQVYGVNASRFRAHQRPYFEQYVQAGGVIYEPGKCILCGICVKLTEVHREPLGLTFIGRGFDVRVTTPFNHTIEEGMQKAADECVKYCPTGALTKKES